MTIQDILSDLRWHRITEVVAVEQLEQLVKEAGEKALDEAASVALNYAKKRMVDRQIKEMTASGLCLCIQDEILKLKETK